MYSALSVFIAETDANVVSMDFVQHGCALRGRPQCRVARLGCAKMQRVFDSKKAFRPDKEKNSIFSDYVSLNHLIHI
jgi:hypothetical protein